MTKTADDVLKEYEKKHGLFVGTPKDVTGLTTGNLAVDWMTGVGGLPRGRITELYGYESSGKTTTALMAAAALQPLLDDGQRIIYLDFEHALDTDYAQQLGINFDDGSFIPLQPSNLEQGAQAALDLIDTGQVPLIVFDSVAAMAPKRLKDGTFDQATVQMLRAKLVSALCASMIESLYNTQTTAVFINHRMEAIDMNARPGLPPRTTTPGGRGLKYYASLRLEYEVGGGIKDKMDHFLTGDESSVLVANKVYVKCVKNKVGEPGKSVEIRSRYGHGFDNAWSALQVLMAHKLVTKSGAWFTFRPEKVPTLTTGDTFQLQGENAVIEKADSEPEWRMELIRVAREQVVTT